MDIESARGQASSIARRTAEKKLAYWLQIAPVMLHSIDETGKFVAVTDYWLSRLGYSREEIIGRSATDIMTPQSRDYAVNHTLPRLFQTGYIEDIEYQVMCKSGEIRDVLLSAVMDESDPDGRRESISVLTDITDRKRVERQLAESEKLYRGMIETQSEIVSMARPTGELIFVNEAYARIYGKTPEEMVGLNMFDFVPPEARSSVEAHIDEVCVSRQLMKNVNQVVMCGGERRSIEWTNRAMADLDGAIIAVHSVGRDIEERLRGEQRLRDSEARYRLLAENSNDVVFQLDRNLVRQYVSPACRDLLGYEPEEMIGNMPTGMAHPDDAPALLATLRTVLRGEQDTYKIIHRMAHRDGRWIWVESNTKAVRDPETNGVIGLIGALRDVSARKLFEEQLAEANQQLSELALVDWLTRLPNRRSFNIAIDREFRRARRERQPLSLLMLDVDWFKAFNDYYGHQAGDECLGSVADLIGSTVQRPGDIAARYGGEEFVIILSNTDQAGAREVASRLQHRLEARAIAHLGSLLGRVTLSIGIATISRDDDDVTLDDLIKQADSALYRAKAEGRNTVCSAP